MAGLLPRVDGGKTELDERRDQRLVATPATRRGRRQGSDERLAYRANQAGGDRLDVLLGQLAGFDALAQQAGEHVAVPAPQREAPGLDRRINRLGDLRVGELGLRNGNPCSAAWTL